SGASRFGAMFCAEATETWRSSLVPPKRTIGVMCTRSKVAKEQRSKGSKSLCYFAPMPLCTSSRLSSPAVAKQHAAAAIVCLLLAIGMTWPLTFAIDRAVIYPGDPLLNAWIVDWDWYATLHQPLHLFQANAF